MSTFGERLKSLRKDHNLTQEQFGKIFFLDKSSISRYEKNSQMPENDLLHKIADYLGVSIDYLLCRTDIKEINSAGNSSEEAASASNLNNRLNKKDEKDVEKLLNQTIEALESQEGLMLNGEILDEEDILLLKQAIKNGLEYAKISNKKKYTPKKYRKDE
jgi:transcriptional regulator with XRE-family HTH domain